MEQRRIKDSLNCPFCEAEEKGFSSAWGCSPEGWKLIEARHLEKHCLHCPTCGQPVTTPDALWKENPWG